MGTNTDINIIEELAPEFPTLMATLKAEFEAELAEKRNNPQPKVHRAPRRNRRNLGSLV